MADYNIFLLSLRDCAWKQKNVTGEEKAKVRIPMLRSPSSLVLMELRGKCIVF